MNGLELVDEKRRHLAELIGVASETKRDKRGEYPPDVKLQLGLMIAHFSWDEHEQRDDSLMEAVVRRNPDCLHIITGKKRATYNGLYLGYARGYVYVWPIEDPTYDRLKDERDYSWKTIGAETILPPEKCPARSIYVDDWVHLPAAIDPRKHRDGMCYRPVMEGLASCLGRIAAPIESNGRGGVRAVDGPLPRIIMVVDKTRGMGRHIANHLGFRDLYDDGTGWTKCFLDLAEFETTPMERRHEQGVLALAGLASKVNGRMGREN